MHDSVDSWILEAIQRNPGDLVNPEEVPADVEAPLRSYHKRLFLYQQSVPRIHYGSLPTSFVPLGVKILNEPPSERIRFLFAAIARVKYTFERNPNYNQNYLAIQGALVLVPLINDLMKEPLPMSGDEVERLFQDVTSLQTALAGWGTPSSLHLLKHLEPFKDNAELIQRLRPRLCELRQALSPTFISNIEESNPYGSNRAMWKLAELLGTSQPGPLERGDAWADAALEYIYASPQRESWLQLLTHARDSKAGKPSEKWLKRGDELIHVVGRDEFALCLRDWLPLFGRDDGYWFADREERNDAYFKGLVWMASHLGEAMLSPLGAALAGSCRAHGKAGVRSQRVATACLWALSRADSPHAVAAMLRVRIRVKHGTILKAIQKSIDELASRLGVSPADLEELSVPDFGLQNGILTRNFDSARAVVEVSGGVAAWSWNNDGKSVKAVPASVKRDFALQLKELKTQVAELEKTLSAQKERLDALLREGKTWSFETWRARYLEHPLMSLLARRLVWRLSNESGHADVVPLENGFVNAQNQDVAVSENAQVALWHPLFCAPDEALAWRRFFEERQLRQPFKQAHREVYLLTDAERQTHTYSNRFASHILKQHQFNSLCAARGWKNSLRLMVDDECLPATKLWPSHNLRAEFWIEGIGQDYGTDTNETGTYLRVSTDQVRFYPLETAPNSAHAGGGGYTRNSRDAPEAGLPLEQIPPLVFSETMRDVDLFVGVASVGADPTWQDGGPLGHFRNYWQDYAWGELGETAKSRADVLSRLLPRLKIRDVAALDGRFLRVQGRKRIYKIHLGSGNILMEPNDQYLCIVPGRDDASNVFLPFEGDRTLAVILSKAFLLADDDKISDASITRQIG